MKEFAIRMESKIIVCKDVCKCDYVINNVIMLMNTINNYK